MLFTKSMFILLFFALPLMAEKKERQSSFLKRNQTKIVMVAAATMVSACSCVAFIYKCCDVSAWISGMLSRLSLQAPSIDTKASDSAVSSCEEQTFDHEDEAQEMQDEKYETRTEFERLAQEQGLDFHARL